MGIDALVYVVVNPAPANKRLLTGTATLQAKVVAVKVV